VSLGFLVDAQLPVRLARWLEERGFQASHVADHALEAATDEAIWQWAGARRLVIVSKDADFAQLSMRRRGGPPVVWLRIGNMTTAALIERLERVWPTVEAALAAGEPLVELR
jgi:predicted nuclease of predicted toxin-antitoxin system